MKSVRTDESATRVGRTESRLPVPGSIEDGGPMSNPLAQQVKVVKNKVGRPFREAHVRVRLGQGFDEA